MINFIIRRFTAQQQLSIELKCCPKIYHPGYTALNLIMAHASYVDSYLTKSIKVPDSMIFTVRSVRGHHKKCQCKQIAK